MKQILNTLTLSICFIFVFIGTSISKPMWIAPGPHVVCGKKENILNVSKRYEESEVMVLQEYTDGTSKSYFILYRHQNTGSWTLIAYNLKNASPEIACILTAGMASYILPDLNTLEKMIIKQQKGLDKQKIKPLEGSQNSNPDAPAGKI